MRRAAIAVSSFAVLATIVSVASGCGDGISDSGTTYVQTPTALPASPPPAAGPAGGSAGFRSPANLAEAVAFDDGNTLEVISCQTTDGTEPGTQYELSLAGDELFEVQVNPNNVVTRVSALAPSPDLNSRNAGGTLEGTVLTGTANFAANDFDWTQLAFAFDTDSCT